MQVMIETWIGLQRNHTEELKQFLKRSGQQAETVPHQDKEAPAIEKRLNVEVEKEESRMQVVATSEGGGHEQASAIDNGSMLEEADEGPKPQE